MDFKKIEIKDLYTGKPDAKDEIESGKLKEFVDSFILPNNFDMDRVINGDSYFLTGYKGTGKTALLRYIENSISTNAISSFFLFKSECTEIERAQFENISKNMTQTISIDNSTQVYANDFKVLWKYFIFDRIIKDDTRTNKKLFIHNKDWGCFEKIIEKTKNNPNSLLEKTQSIKLSIPICFPNYDILTSPTIEWNKENMRNYFNFAKQIEIAESYFKKTTRTEIPYYIFIDELETSSRDLSLFYRDLALIRDLIFTVKELNALPPFRKTQTKIIVAVRKEIINAINRFIESKELNKALLGFETPLNWEYNNTSFQHPIMKILIKRIAISEEQIGLPKKTDNQIYKEWFPPNIHGKETSAYILHHTWNKPRDIVRLLISAQNSQKKTETLFSQAVFESFRKQYSQDSLNEMREEMSALYDQKDINNIIQIFTGFKIRMSYEEIEERIKKFYRNTGIAERLTSILSDLYRIGFIGNISPNTGQNRWYHRGDEELILTEWNIIVHQALLPALSLSSSRDYTNSLLPKRDDIVDTSVKHIGYTKVTVSFQYRGKVFKGVVFIDQITNEYIRKGEINKFVKEDEQRQAKIIGTDSGSRYILSFKL